MLRYLRVLHLGRVSRVMSRALIAVLLAVTVAGGYVTTTNAAELDLEEWGGIGITAAACGLSGPACIAMAIVLVIVGMVMLLVIYLLFNLMQFLVWSLLQIASYNDFAHATVVDLGWVVMRDVVNMFFIVVLLIIAFSTIIRYKAFHYKEHLPKLLLMAVLINFSRTLVGVMIDFSQVITLTFINGFAQAATGNFMKVFGVSGLLTAVQNTGFGDLGTTFIAELFALMILVISCTTLTILLLYFVIRMVSLWVLVILSPLAFFATALPGKLQKALGPLTGPWWSQLSAWLTGGPIVAFFLWLSLAVAQQGTNEFTNIIGGASDQELKNNRITSTEVGKPENFGLLIISVVLMLTGVKTAVSVAGSTGNDFLGKAAQKIRSGNAGMNWAVRRTGQGVGRGLVGLGAADWAANKQINWNKGFAKDIAGYPVVGSLMATGYTAATNKIRGFQAGVAKDAQKRVEGNLSNLTDAERLTSIDNMLAGNLQIRGVDRMAALKRENVNFATSGGGQKAISTQEEERIKTKRYGQTIFTPEEEEKIKSQRTSTLMQAVTATNPTWTSDQLEKEVAMQMKREDDQVKAQAADAAKTNLQKILADGKKSAQSSGDADFVKKIDEAYKKNPALYVDPKEVAKTIGNFERDNMIEPSAMQDLLVSAALLNKHDLVDKDGALIGNEQEILDAEPIKKFLALGGDRAMYLKAAVQDFTGSAEGKERLAKLSQSLRAGVADGDTQDSRLYLSKSSDGKRILFAHSKEATEVRRPLDIGGLMTGRIRMTSDEDVYRSLPEATQSAVKSAFTDLGLKASQFKAPLNTEQVQSLTELRNIYTASAPSGGYSDSERNMMTQAQVKGLLSTVAFQYDTEQKKFASDASKNAAQSVYEEMMKRMESSDGVAKNEAINFITNTDVDAVAKGGDMRDMLVQTFNTASKDQIRTLFSDGTDAQSKQLKALMKELKRQVDGILNRGGAANPQETELIALRDKLGVSVMRAHAGEGKKRKGEVA